MRWLKRLVCLLRGHTPKYKLNKTSGLIEVRCKHCDVELQHDFKGRFW